MKHKNSIHRRVSMHRHHCETRYRDSDRQYLMLAALNIEGSFPLSDADWQKNRFWCGCRCVYGYVRAGMCLGWNRVAPVVQMLPLSV